MSKRLGRFAGTITLVTICCVAVFSVPIAFFNISPVLSSLFVLVLLAAFAAAWLTELIYRKSYPNLFRPFEKPRRNITTNSKK